MTGSKSPARHVRALSGFVVLGMWYLLSTTSAGETPTPRVYQVPLGQTRLLTEVGASIGYRLDGAETDVSLGYQWHGHDRISGVWYEDYGSPDADGNRAIFMHCPWRPGPGIAFADTVLLLPDAQPIRLEVTTSLRPDAPASDGVTYRVKVDDETLLEDHCLWKTAERRAISLDAYRGRTVRLRLEVDPGSARNPRDDWFLWQSADIGVGTHDQVAAAEAEREHRKQRALGHAFARASERAEQSLLPVSSRDTRGLDPSTFENVANTSHYGDEIWIFTARDSFDEVRYEMSPKVTPAGEVHIGVTLNGRRLHPLPFVLQLRPLVDGRDSGEAIRVTASQPQESDGSLRLTLQCGDAGQPFSMVMGARISGKTLRLSFAAPPGCLGGVGLYRRGGKTLPAVYASTPTVRYADVDAYASATADLWHSNATSAGSDGTSYAPLTDGSFRPLRDEFILTVSSRYEETLPNPPHPRSPFLQELSGRVLLDAWGGSFQDDAAWLQGMAGYGLNSLLIIKHVWQRDGYDRSYPNVFPANAAMGGDEGLRELARTATTLGHRFCVHENFYDFYPNAEDFNGDDCALGADGSRIPGWDRGPVKAVILKPSRLMQYARKFSPRIAERYGCNATYHDIMPTWQVDRDADVPDSGMIRVTHATTRQLCDYDRRLFNGPVLFEAADPSMAGVYDGGTANGQAIETFPLHVAHELLKVHPKMSNHGLSYYERWLTWGYGPGWSSYVMTDRELDKYRAMTVAFGRTGFIGHQLMKHPHGVVREYWLMRAFARAYTDRLPVTLRYAAAGGEAWVDAATAAEFGVSDRLRVTYEDGQEVRVNWAETPWDTGNARLPRFGSLTHGPRALAWTALVDGQIADYAEVDGAVYADARSHVWQPPNRTPPIRAEATGFEDLGDGRFRVAVRWLPERTPERDLLVFWHFLDTGIAFQRDHYPALRTPQWSPGDPVLDGPRTLTIPSDSNADSFTFAVGLYDKQGRFPMVGVQDALTLGTVRLARKDGQIASIHFDPGTAGGAPGGDPERYLLDANRQRRILRFPAVSTDGAVVLLPGRTPRTLEVVPVPLTEPVVVGLPGRFDHVSAIGRDGEPFAEVKTDVRDGMTWFSIGGDAKAVRWRISGVSL